MANQVSSSNDTDQVLSPVGKGGLYKYTFCILFRATSLIFSSLLLHHTTDYLLHFLYQRGTSARHRSSVRSISTDLCGRTD